MIAIGSEKLSWRMEKRASVWKIRSSKLSSGSPSWNFSLNARKQRLKLVGADGFFI